MHRKLECWGGIECTINRVNNTYFDQLNISKHYTREDDIRLIAELGITTLRYPFLWERHEPRFNCTIDWTYQEGILRKLDSYGITPIAGLLHHGSGPAYTNLLDDKFPEFFALYAGKVARQFPFLQYYTPINEPLTTARFSGLYGHWYPHHRKDVNFAKMLLNQVKGTVLAMKEIRKVNPGARLLQTEDLSKTYSTGSLNYQAAFENERRWVTYDLLCGKLQPGDPMWNYFIRLGINKKTLDFFNENVTSPDIMGFNYYITSERFLDENLTGYPDCTRGGNEIQEYSDVEAVRVNHGFSSGLRVLLEEASARFGLPMAITEAHINCGREDQLRWLNEIFNTCSEALQSGLDIRAITFWSLFGAYGWNDLVTGKRMEYEPGAYDLRSGQPRPTAIAAFIKGLTSETKYAHSLLEQKGWWHQKDRFYKKKIFKMPAQRTSITRRPLLITGKTGTLGQAFAKICTGRKIDFIVSGRESLDITDDRNIQDYLDTYNPWAVINTAGFVKVDEAENNVEECMKINTEAAVLLSKACKERNISFVTFSSDLVFDGQKNEPYVETDIVNPLNVYGISKAQAEKQILLQNPAALIIRTSAFFGPWDMYNFVTILLKHLSENKEFTVADNIFISPTYVPHLVTATVDLLIDSECGIWHLVNDGAISWKEFALMVAEKAGYDPALIVGVNLAELNLSANRPQNSVLQSTRGKLMPTLENAINAYFIESRTITNYLVNVV